MAKEIVNPEVIEVDGTNLADHVSSIDLPMPYDDHDTTGMGGTPSHEHTPGLRDDSVTLNFWQDYDAGSVDAVIGAAHASGEPIVIRVQRTDTTASDSNPEYTFTGRVFNYSPLSGSAGEPSATEITFMDATGEGIVRNPAFS